MNDVSKNIKLMYWYNFFSYFIFASPLLVLFFAQITHSFTLAMSLFSIQKLSGAFFELPTGFLSDKIGRKWVCVLGALSQLLCFIFYAIADSYLILIIGSLFYGLSKALSSGNNDALLYETTVELDRKQEYHKILSRASGLLQLGLAIASVLSAGFALISLRAVIIATLIPSFITFILTLFLVETNIYLPEKKNVFKHIVTASIHLWNTKRLRFLGIGRALNYGLNESAFHFNAAFFKQFVPIWSLGIFRSAGHLFSSLGCLFSYKINQKIGTSKTIVGGFLGDNLFNILAVLSFSWIGLILRFFTSFFFGVYDPVLNTLVQEDSSNTERATIGSIMSLMNSLSYSICTLLIGVIADFSSPFWGLLTMYTLAMISNYIFVIALKNKPV